MSEIKSVLFYSLWPILTLLVGCSALPPENSGRKLPYDLFNISPPPENAKNDKISLYSTYFYKYFPKLHPEGIPVRDRNGNSISDTISKVDFCLGSIEGVMGAPVNGVPKVFTIDGIRGKSDPNNVDCLKVIHNIKKEDRQKLSYSGRQYYTLTQEEFGLGVNG